MFYKFHNKIDCEQFWETITATQWKKLNYPWRPNQQELSLIENWIQEKHSSSKKLKVAVLGSTPEFREILQKYNLIADIVDFSKNMYEEMGSLLTLSKPKEKFFQIDWIEHLKHHPHYYDIIISDLIDRLLDKKTNINIYSCIKNSLKNNGILIKRNDIHINNHKTDLHKLISTGSLSECADLLFFVLSPQCLNNNQVDINKMKKIIRKQIETTNNSKLIKCLSMVLEKWTSNPISYYSWSEKLYSKITFKNFNPSIQHRIYLSENIYIETSLWQRITQK